MTLNQTRCRFMNTLRLNMWTIPLTAMLFLSTSALAQGPIPVSTTELGLAIIYPQITAPASVASDNDTKISAQIEARILQIGVRVGDFVKKDSELMRLDQTDYELDETVIKARLKALKAQLRLASAQLGRARKLAKQRSASEELLNQRQSEVAVLNAKIQEQTAALSRAQIKLKRCIIYAPFNGSVVERLASIGELARPGTPLLRLVDIDNIEVTADVQQQQLNSLQHAISVVFKDEHASYPVQLKRVVPVIDFRQQSHTVRLTFLGRNAPPGDAGTLEWHESSPFIPANLLVRRDNMLGVFQIVGEHAKFTPLPNAEEGRPTVTSLPLDTKIIVDGRFAARDGSPVDIK